MVRDMPLATIQKIINIVKAQDKVSIILEDVPYYVNGDDCDDFHIGDYVILLALGCELKLNSPLKHTNIPCKKGASDEVLYYTHAENKYGKYTEGYIAPLDILPNSIECSYKIGDDVTKLLNIHTIIAPIEGDVMSASVYKVGGRHMPTTDELNINKESDIPIELYYHKISELSDMQSESNKYILQVSRKMLGLYICFVYDLKKEVFYVCDKYRVRYAEHLPRKDMGELTHSYDNYLGDHYYFCNDIYVSIYKRFSIDKLMSVILDNVTENCEKVVIEGNIVSNKIYGSRVSYVRYEGCTLCLNKILVDGVSIGVYRYTNGFHSDSYGSDNVREGMFIGKPKLHAGSYASIRDIFIRHDVHLNMLLSLFRPYNFTVLLDELDYPQLMHYAKCKYNVLELPIALAPNYVHNYPLNYFLDGQCFVYGTTLDLYKYDIETRSLKPVLNSTLYNNYAFIEAQTSNNMDIHDSGDLVLEGSICDKSGHKYGSDVLHVLNNYSLIRGVLDE